VPRQSAVTLVGKGLRKKADLVSHREARHARLIQQQTGAKRRGGTGELAKLLPILNHGALISLGQRDDHGIVGRADGAKIARGILHLVLQGLQPQLDLVHFRLRVGVPALMLRLHFLALEGDLFQRFLGQAQVLFPGGELELMGD
jgi:hypothetical protein